MNYKPWGLALASGIIFLSHPAKADPPAQVFTSISISTGGPEFTAYAVWNERDVWDNRPEWARIGLEGRERKFREEFLKVIDPICITTTLKWLTDPAELPVISGKLSCYKRKVIQTLRAGTGEYDGRISFGGPRSFSASKYELIGKKPLYQCGNEHGQYWLSYNSAIGERELAPFCSFEIAKLPDAMKRYKEMAEAKAVIFLELPAD